MEKLVLNLVLIPALVIVSLLGGMFILTPEMIAGFAVNSIDTQVVQPWRVGVALLALAVPLLVAVVYTAKNTRQSSLQGA